MGRSVDGMKLEGEKYFRDFIPYNQPEWLPSCEEFIKTPAGRELSTNPERPKYANYFTIQISNKQISRE
jgi:hypothetical protein